MVGFCLRLLISQYQASIRLGRRGEGRRGRADRPRGVGAGCGLAGRRDCKLYVMAILTLHVKLTCTRARAALPVTLPTWLGDHVPNRKRDDQYSLMRSMRSRCCCTALAEHEADPVIGIAGQPALVSRTLEDVLDFFVQAIRIQAPLRELGLQGRRRCRCR